MEGANEGGLAGGLDEPSTDAIDRMAAIDDYLGGFAGREALESAGATPGTLASVGLLDTLLLLRQSAAAAGVVPPQPAIEKPDRIGRYEILGLAGEGGFAVVWEAFDPLLRRRVAIKLRRPDALLSATARRRFVREAEIAARLVHPHLVTIHEVGSDDGNEFIAEEFCAGGSLADWLAGHPGPLAPRSAAWLVLALARATSYAHQSGVIHRDIKPANVLLVPASAGENATLPANDDTAPATGYTVKLADFGLGKLTDIDAGDSPTQLTRSGSCLGTPAWMAPEQIDRSFGEVAPTTDVHGLGLLLDRLLTGRALRSGGTTAETYRQVLFDDAVPADRAAGGVPSDLAAVCLKCLAKKPQDRYTSAAALADDLVRWLDGRPTVARPMSRVARAARWLRSRPIVSTLAVALLAAAAAAGWAGLERLREANRGAAQREELRRQAAVAELRQGFETLRTGNIAAALAKLDKTRSLDPALADSFAGRWLVRRAHNEVATLLSLEDGPGGSAAAAKDLYSIAVSPDGRLAAIAAADGRLRLMRGLDSTPSTVAVPAHDEINDVCFSPDGSMLATAGQDGRLRWWRIEDDRPIAAGESEPGAGPLYAVAFTSDGTQIATGGEDRVVRLLSLDSPRSCRDLFEFKPPDGRNPEIESLAIVDARTLAASCGDRVVLLDLASGRVCRDFELSEPDSRRPVIGSLELSPDGSRIAGCGSDSKAHVWDVKTGRIVTSLPTHPAWVQGCCFSPDGSRLATACRDGGVRLFDAATGAPLGRLVGHSGRVWSVGFEPSGTMLTAGADGTVRRWDSRLDFATAVLRQIPAAGNEFVQLEEGPPVRSGRGGRSFIAIDFRGKIVHFDTENGFGAEREPLHAIPPRQQKNAFAMAVDAGRLKVAVSWYPAQRLDVITIEPTFSVVASTPDPPEPRVATMPWPLKDNPGAAIASWTPEGQLVVCSRSGSLCMLSPDLTEATTIQSPLEDPVHSLAAAPCGPPRLAAAGRRTAIIPLTPSRAGRSLPLALQVGEDSRSVAWSPDASILACGTQTGRVLLFDATTGVASGQFVPHEHRIVAAEFSPDGRTLITADSDCLRISDVATLTMLDEVRPGWLIRSARLTADGKCLVVGGIATTAPPGASGRIAVVEIDRP